LALKALLGHHICWGILFGHRKLENGKKKKMCFKEKRNRNKGETMIISKSEGKVLLVKRNVDLILI
jgi:hypothetical protein